ncbi:MAG: hypothetical protein HFG54_04145 [Lachnospiraceae bacterium]|jgi:hypothetical protein|nr:hypothetical protein [Lachnospiraceae bacterium]
MAFGIKTNPPKPVKGYIRREEKRVACECWFTSTGRVMPLMLKIEDESGEIQTVREIWVHSQEKKRYAGILSMEFDCTLCVRNRKVRGWLIYYQEENRWGWSFSGYHSGANIC